MTFEASKLLLVLLGTGVIGGIAVLVAKGTTQRLMLIGLLGGLLWYSGIGAADSQVPFGFIFYYFGLAAAIVIGFHGARVIFLPIAVKLERRVAPTLGPMTGGLGWVMVILAYLLLSTFPLVWPESRLSMLFSPPAPDLSRAFFLRFDETPDPVSRIVAYAQLLMSPFFLVALYRLRSHVVLICLILCVLLYLRYVASAYISRGEVLVQVVMMVMAVWILRPSYRRILLLSAVALMPLLFYALYWYGMARIGATVQNEGFLAAAGLVLESELSFPKYVGVAIVESEARVDLPAYFTWLFTLPIPKVLTGEIAGARVNYEISEIVLGRPMGSYGWYVVLPGLVAESVYIYGRVLFWVHGLFLGALAALFARIAERLPQLLFLYLHVALLFAYSLNRGGVSSLLPPVINSYLLFYVFIFLTALWPQRRASAVPAAVSR